MPEYSIFQPGEQAVTISLGNTIESDAHLKVLSMRDCIQRNAFPGLLDVVVAYSTLTVIYDLYKIKSTLAVNSVFEFVAQQLVEAYNNSSGENQPQKQIKKIPVCYESPFSPDLEWISSRNHITVEQIIELHSSQTYTVYMIGFLPGFAYLGKIPEQLVVPRKATPRARVEKGSVGIAGHQTGIYPVVSPGGWQIIGRTPISMFDKNADPPVKLEAGDAVQFYPVTAQNFDQFQA